MGDVRKTPSPAKRAGSIPKVDFDPAKLATLLVAFQHELLKLNLTTGQIVPGKVKMGAGLLQAAKVMETFKGDVESWRERFKAAALDHYKAGGVFESGKVLVAFPESLSRRPKWQSIAVSVAGELAALRKVAFDPQAYITGTLEATVPTTSISMQLNEVQ